LAVVFFAAARDGGGAGSLRFGAFTAGACAPFDSRTDPPVPPA
jgi:hypothetical protein